MPLLSVEARTFFMHLERELVGWSVYERRHKIACSSARRVTATMFLANRPGTNALKEEA